MTTYAYIYSTPDIYLAAYLLKNNKINGIRTFNLTDVLFLIQGDSSTIQQDVLDFNSKRASIGYEKFQSYLNRWLYLLEEVKEKYLSEAS